VSWAGRHGRNAHCAGSRVYLCRAAARDSFSPPDNFDTGLCGDPAGVFAALQREGLAVPATYRQACAATEPQPSGCTGVPAGPIPAALKRPVHFPVLRAGQRCPASRGTRFTNSYFGGIALGTGPVRVIAGSTRHSVAALINPSSSPPWLALKTLWFSLPAYQGPFVIRAKRLGRPGPVTLADPPVIAPMVVPPGPTLNSAFGYRTVPGGLFVKTPDATPGKLMG
jgi:hypothetical protein